VSKKYKMHTKLLIAPNRKTVFPNLTVDIFTLLARRYKCPVPPI
jgi:hypothetical protein